MKRFISNILKEAEDFSDDFFQDKHINKRKEDIKRRENEKQQRLSNSNKKVFINLNNGIKEIKRLYRNKIWEDEREQLFLKLFSKLHAVVRYTDYRKRSYGCFLSNKHNKKVCFYDLHESTFWVSDELIWAKFEEEYDFDVNFYAVQAFLTKMIKKYFKIYNVTADFSKFHKLIDYDND